MSEARVDRGDATAEAGGAIDFLFVGVDGERFALEAGYVGGIVRDPALSRVPGTPPAIAGVTEVNGEVTAAIDGRAIADGDPTDGDRPPILVSFARTDREQATGLLVDVVTGLSTRPVGDVATPGRGDEPVVAVLGGDDERRVLDPRRVIELARGREE